MKLKSSNLKSYLIFLISILIISISPLPAYAKHYSKSNNKSFNAVNSKYAAAHLKESVSDIDYTPEEKRALYEYTLSSILVNDMLDYYHSRRNLLTDNIKKKAISMDSAINRLSLPFNIRVYRYAKLSTLRDMGISNVVINKYYRNNKFYSGILKAVKGKKYNKYSYMSTTIIDENAFNYRPIEIVINIPKGTKAAYLGLQGFSAYIDEQEVLLPRNSVIKVYSARLKKNNKRLVLYADFLGIKKADKSLDIEMNDKQMELLDLLKTAYEKAYSQKNIDKQIKLLSVLDNIQIDKNINKNISLLKGILK